MYPSVQDYQVVRCEAEVHPGKPVDVERLRVKAAAVRARKVFPGPVGDYLATDLESWANMSLRYDQRGITGRLIDVLMGMPDPDGDDV